MTGSSTVTMWLLVASLLSQCHGWINANLPVAVQGLPNTCLHDCTACQGQWYNVDAAGKCLARTANIPTFYTFDYNCHLPGKLAVQQIKDPLSCAQVVANQSEVKWVNVTAHFDVIEGCSVQAQNPGMLFWNLVPVQRRVCFGMRQTILVVISTIGGVLIGISMGLLSGASSRKNNSAFVDRLIDSEASGEADEEYHKHNFAPGSKMVAKNSVVGTGRLTAVMFYRSMQVIANFWVPMTLFWFFAPWLVWTWYFILYFLPTFCKVGLPLLSEFRYLITPPHCSLLGIATNQDAAVKSFIYHTIRPFLMVGAIYGSGAAIVGIARHSGHTDAQISRYVTNGSGYFHLALANPWGALIVGFTVGTTIIGTLLFVLLSLCPIYSSLTAPDEYNGECITYEEDPELYNAMHAKARDIKHAAAKDQCDDQDRVSDLEDVSALTPLGVFIQIALAIIDFFAYVYRIIVFMRDGRYLLACIVIAALCESITTLIYHRHLQEAYTAITDTAKCGIPTVHFLGLVQWDDGIAGIPALGLSIYGLPLARPTVYGPFVSIFFLVTGTRALACYLGDVSDARMFEKDSTKVKAEYAGMFESSDDLDEVGLEAEE